MNKQTILIWTIVVLVILNMSTVATILYHNYQDNIGQQSIVLDTEGQNPLNGRYFRQTLGFTTSQMEVFRQVNHEFRPNANSIIIKIDSLKSEMFSEIKKPACDTVKLNALALETGKLHTELKQETNRFYLKIKAVCTPEQLDKLQDAFSPLFRNEPCNGDGQGRRGKGQGNGFRNQQINN
jgi:Spy/CpxP family protein refolding chaperone